MKSLILLHGALGGPEQLLPLAEKFRSRYQLYRPAFPGHAGRPVSEFSMESFSGFLEAYISKQELERPLVFGYSMGGYAALDLAARRPGLLGAVATLASRLDWNPEGAARETGQLQPDVMEQKIPAFTTSLRDRHAPLDWKEVVRNTAAMMTRLGAAPLLNDAAYTRITDPVLLLLGDRDKMVTLEETRAAHRLIKGSQLGVLPGAPHPLEKVPLELLAAHLDYFFGTV